MISSTESKSSRLSGRGPKSFANAGGPLMGQPRESASIQSAMVSVSTYVFLPSRFMRLGPRGTRREESHPGGWGLPVGVSAAAALRAAVPAPTGRTGRRSAFQAVPALRLSQLDAVPPACGGLRRAEGPHRENCPAFPASALACRCEAGVPSLCTARRTEPYIENTRRGGCHGERRLPLPVGFRPILAGVR